MMLDDPSISSMPKRLEFENFRGFESKTVVIPDKGLIQLDGPNGAGKSTILNAFPYVLYDDLKKPYPRGQPKKKVKVVLSDGNLVITRTSNPKTLTVLETDEKGVVNKYEADSAQKIIDDTYGSAAKFRASSYIAQRIDKSVLVMTPSEQQAFIESISYDGASQGSYRQEVKKEMHAAKENRTRIQGQLDVLIGQLSSVEQDCKALEIKMPENIDVSNLDGLIQATTTEINQLNQQQKDITIELARLASIADKNKQADYLSAKNKLRSMKNKKELTSCIESLEKKISLLEKDVDLIQEWEMYNKSKAAIEQEIQDITDEKNNILDSLRQQLLTDAQLRTAMAMLADLSAQRQLHIDKGKSISEIKNLCASLKNLGIDGDSAKKVLSQAKQQVAECGLVYKCPCCQESLQLSSDRLIKSKSKTSSPDNISRFSELNMLCIKLESSLHNMPKISKPISEINTGISAMTSRISAHQRNLESIEKLTHSSIPVSIIKRRDALTRPSREIDNDPTCLSRLIADRKTLSGYKFQLAEYDDMRRVIVEYEQDKAKFDELTQIPILESQRTDIMQRIQELNDTRSEYYKWSSIASQLGKYNARISEKQSLEAQVKDAQKQKTTLDKTIARLIELDGIAKQAEILAIEKTIERLNEAAKQHLANLFKIPITVRLCSCKKDKMQMTVVVSYKGSIFDDVDSLSAGESQKCSLAFILAANDISGSRMLFLDECLNNLSSEHHSDVIECIKDVSVNKLALVVSHEAEQGVFDQVIKVDD
jgi:DNA repair exonuclease SbcCD ATPase subunit